MTYRSDEQREFAALIRRAARRPGPPLLAGGDGGLGKTHAYSIPLAEAAADGRRIAIAFPTRYLINQYVNSNALLSAQRVNPSFQPFVVLPRESFSADSDYRDHKAAAATAQVILVTHAAAVLDVRSGYVGLTQRDIVLFDEADQLADAADLFCSAMLPASVLAAAGCTSRDPQSVVTTLSRRHDLDDDNAAALYWIRNALTRPASYKLIGWDRNSNLVLRHLMPGRMLSASLQRMPRAIFVSATMLLWGTFDAFASALGIPAIDPASRHIFASHHGQLHVHPRDKPLGIEAIAETVTAVRRPALVLTTSHDLSASLGALLPHARTRCDSATPIAEVMRDVSDSDIVITAGAWAGLDIPEIDWRSVVIPQTPYGVPVEIDNTIRTHYLDSVASAVRRTMQGVCRGLRAPDAEVDLHLLDPRSSRKLLREGIPARFRNRVQWPRVVG